MTDSLSLQVSGLLGEAQRSAVDAPSRELLSNALDRMEEPLRLAIAGKVKAGKSTLLNSLLGEQLAPTDAGECTRVVTWYRWSDQPRVVIHPRGASPVTRPFSRDGGALDVDLGDWSSADLEQIDVWWPSRRLRELTIIDTPGLASLSVDLSTQTAQTLAADGEEPGAADAVVYLLRHVHPSDIRFLESFHGDELVHGTPMNAVGVLSRADEIGSARTDALDVAARVADRYREDARLHRVCPVVVPVAGLLAQAAATLREHEYRALAAIAATSSEESTDLLLTADRFASRATAALVPTVERAHLLSRFGLFGVRLGVSLIRSGRVEDSSGLAKELTDRSGIASLRAVLHVQFMVRSRVLKARMGLAILRQVLESGGCHDSDQLRRRLEAVESSAHEFVEVRTLNALRADEIDVSEQLYDELERLLGGSGHDHAGRLGLSEQAGSAQVETAARAALATWQRRAEHPLSSRAERSIARVATRTIEGILTELRRPA